MTEREALKHVLDFIERINKDGWIFADFEPQMYAAITALREALAQPAQQELVGYEYYDRRSHNAPGATIEMAREAGFNKNELVYLRDNFTYFAELVRDDERGSWPDKMDAMELQVDNLTYALAKAVADEREACAKVIESHGPHQPYGAMFAAAIRARSKA